MNNDFDPVGGILDSMLMLLIWLAVGGGTLCVFYSLLSWPMRQANRARLFLDLLDYSNRQGRPIEETLIAIAQSRDMSLGIRFHLLAAWLEEGLRLGEGMAKVRLFLPAPITSMLQAGQKIGNLEKVMPACRQLLKDGVSQTRGALNYLVIMTLVITPVGLFVFGYMNIFVVPKFLEISQGNLGGDAHQLAYLFGHAKLIGVLQFSVLLLLWFGFYLYQNEQKLTSWFPFLDRLYFRLPWRRKRMQRDFSTMLAILLDSNVPEAEAVTLAADCTANRVFQKRAAQVVELMRQGVELPKAIQSMDDTGEFGWRLANCFHSRQGFLQTLIGWHEALDAKAFQQEQAAAHIITSGLVLWSGIFVGLTAVSIFMFLTSLVNEGILW